MNYREVWVKPRKFWTKGDIAGTINNPEELKFILTSLNIIR